MALFKKKQSMIKINKPEKEKKDKVPKAPAPPKTGKGGALSVDLKDLKLSDLRNAIPAGGLSRGKLPTKTSINLMPKDENTIDLHRVIPVILIIVILVGVLGKFFVVDKLIEMTNAQNRVATMQAEIEQAYATIEQMGDVEEQYAHYTYSGMTEEELTRVDRTDVMKLAQAAINTGVKVNSWSVTENMMTLQVRARTLQKLNQTAQALEKKKIVERCIINTANKATLTTITTDDRKNEGKYVTATYILYLINPDTIDIAEEQAKMEEGAEQ